MARRVVATQSTLAELQERPVRYAERMKRMSTAATFEMLARGKALEAQGRSIVHLGIGEPDFDTPLHIREAAERAMREGWTHYGPAAGLPDLRAAIAKDWQVQRGIPCGPEHVVVTPGAKPILFFTMLATLEPGDEVLIPSPAFPTYASVASFLDARVVPVPLDAARGFDLDLAAVRERLNSRTRMIVLNSPHNPTGGVLPLATLHALAGLAEKHDLLILSDEIYSRMVYEADAPSIASLPGMAERTAVVDGFSKTWAMTGWRCRFSLWYRDFDSNHNITARLLRKNVAVGSVAFTPPVVLASVASGGSVDTMRRASTTAITNRLISPGAAFYYVDLDIPFNALQIVGVQIEYKATCP